jgi:hypothetical protein
MTIDYGHHTLRLNRQYDARTRRSLERFKEAIDTLWTEVDSISAGTGVTVNYSSIDINGNANETVANPTAAGQILVRAINKVTSAGTYTVYGRFVEYPTGSIQTKTETNSDYTTFVAISVESGDTWTWFVIQGGGWTFGVA